MSKTTLPLNDSRAIGISKLLNVDLEVANNIINGRFKECFFRYAEAENFEEQDWYCLFHAANVLRNKKVNFNG